MWCEPALALTRFHLDYTDLGMDSILTSVVEVMVRSTSEVNE